MRDEKIVVCDRSAATPEGEETEDDAFERWAVETRAAMEEGDTARVDVYVRSMLPPPGAKESQTALIKRLVAAEDHTPLQEVTVNVWGERFCRCERCRETHPGRRILQTVTDLEAWGDTYDATVSPYFERTTQQSALTGNSHEGIVPPRVTAALSVDGRLRGVFPCQFAGDPHSVHDLCAVLDGPTDGDVHPDSVDTTV